MLKSVQFEHFFRMNAMTIVDLVETSAGQAIPLPEEFRFEASTVSIRREGDAVIVEPIKPNRWPEHFFDDIHIDDPAFARPPQRTLLQGHCSITSIDRDPKGSA